jgi:SulP family sulfate permease
MYLLVGITIAIIYLLPKLIKAIPSALIAIILITSAVIFGGINVGTVGDMGEISRSFPLFHVPNVLFNFETFMIILPYAITLSIVGILESLLTATIVDDMTDTKSDKNKEVRGQGYGNVVVGFFGGMASCAMIGQSVINVKSGGRGRLSSLVAGLFLLFLIMVLGDIVAMIPMAALVGVMIVVSISTFDWRSLWHIAKMPRSDAFVMVLTVGIVVYTHDLAKGVLAGVVVSALIFGWRMSRIRIATKRDAAGAKIYNVSGPLFFGSMTRFVDRFEYEQDPEEIIIDFSMSQVWDHSAVTGIAKVMHKYQRLEKQVTLIGLNKESEQMVEKVGLSAPSGH